MKINRWPSETEFEPAVGDKVQFIYSVVGNFSGFDVRNSGEKYQEGDLILGEIYTVLRPWYVWDGIYAWQIQIKSSLGNKIWVYAIHFSKATNSVLYIKD